MALIDDLALLLDQDGKELKTNTVATSTTGTATQTQTVAGASRTVRGYGAPYGAGATDRIRSAATADLSTGAVSVFAWVWVDSSGSDTPYGRVYQKGSGTSYHDLMCMNIVATSVNCVRRTATGGQSFGIPVTAGAWQLVGYTSTNATNGVNPAGVIGYVNGAAVTLVAPQISDTSAVSVPTAAYDIGNRDDGTRGFDGMVYQIAFFPRVLTPAEVADLYSNWAQLSSSAIPVSQDAATSYSVIGAISQDAATSYNVIGAVSQDAATSFSVLSASSISADSSTQYSVIGAVLEDSATSYNIIGTVSQDAATSYNILSPLAATGIGLARGTIDDALTVITPNGTTPLVWLKNRFNSGDGAASNGSVHCSFKVTGVNGLTPFFEVDRTNWGYTSTQKFMFSYTGLPDSWTFFDVSTQPTGKYAFNHGTAFTQDVVYIAWNFNWPVTATLPWIQSLAASGYVSEAPSSAGAGYVFATRSATTDGATAGAGNVVSALPLYSFKISTAGLAPDGTAKRKMVLMSGVHADEDSGNYALRGACAFLTSADAMAVSIRSWFDIFVYPLISAAGRAGGAQRADFENLYKTADSNRNWNSAILETVVKHQAAIQTDCGATVHVQYDFHGDPFQNLFWGYIIGAAGTQYRDKYVAALAQHVTATMTSWATDNPAGTTNAYFNLQKSTPYCITPESGWLSPASTVAAETYGANHLKAISTLIANGEWGVSLAAVSADAATNYNIIGVVSQDAATSFSVLSESSVSADSSTQYSVIGTVYADAIGSYDIIGSVVQDAGTGYSILSPTPLTLIPAYLPITASNRFIGPVTAELHRPTIWS